MTNLGRIQLHDPKSRKHEYPQRRITSRTNVRHAMNALHVDQFYLGACVGFSGDNWMNCALCKRNRTMFNKVHKLTSRATYLDNNDGIYNYSGATRNDPWPGEYPPTDEGSSAIGLMKFWKQLGVIPSYTWTFTFDAFLAALQRQPVLVGTNWFDDMMSTSADGIVHSSGSGSGGGHEYLATEIRWDKQLIGYENSWGQHPPHFGINGRFWMPFDLAEELIIHQGGDVAVPGLL